MDKLISMTDFFLDQHLNRWSPDVDKIVNYANFLKQPLTLGMFVPCDADGNVYVDYRIYNPLKGYVCEPYQGLFEVSKKGKDIELLNEPQLWKDDQRYYNKRKYNEALAKYQEAKDRVLFEGFHLIGIDKASNEYQLEMIGKDFWLDFIDNECTFEDEFIVDDVEELLNISRCVELVLTESAKKQIGIS